jgi:hypothetical protein
VSRVATFHWRTPAPTSVDEELAVYDDGHALLAVRSSRRLLPAIGSYTCTPDGEDLHLLTAAGPGPIEFDLLMPPAGPEMAALMSAADRVAATGEAAPEAVATFHVRTLGSPADGMLTVSLLVVGSGARAVEFELDPAASSVVFRASGQPVGWVDVPELAIGFVTPDAEGLGGIHRRAIVEPGAYGAIVFDVPLPAGSGAVSVRVAGWLAEALPDHPMPERFAAATAEVPIDG